MPRPRHADIGPHRIKITWAAERWPDDNDPDAFRVGECEMLANTIKVATDQAPTQQAGTVIHELLHASIHQSNLRCMAGWSSETEEAIILALEPKILEIFTRNPRLVAWLASGGVG